MVSAGSLKYGNDTKKKVLFAVSSLIVLVVAVFGFMAVKNSGGSDDLSPAVSRPIDESITSQIEKLPFKVSQPEKIPTEFIRTAVQVISPAASTSGCEEVIQTYSLSSEGISDDMSEEEFLEALENADPVGYIDIYNYSEDCPFPRPEDAEAYSVGDYSGWVSDSDPQQSVLYELVVNQALVRVETDLLREEMSPVLERFVPFSTTPPVDSVVLTNT